MTNLLKSTAIRQNELLNSETSKLIYYLLGITAATIGFAISISHDSKPSYHMLIWLVSVVCLAISFWCGIRLVLKTHELISFEVNFLMAHGNIQEVDLSKMDQLKSLLLGDTTLLMDYYKYILETIRGAICNEITNKKQSIKEEIENISNEKLLYYYEKTTFNIQGIVENPLILRRNLQSSITKHLKVQLYCLFAGLIFLFLWHCMKFSSQDYIWVDYLMKPW